MLNIHTQVFTSEQAELEAMIVQGSILEVLLITESELELLMS